MQIKKYAATLVFGLMGIFTASAQDVMPEAMPTRLVAERIVSEITPLADAHTLDIPAVKVVSYNSSFGESVVQTALQYIGTRYSYGSRGPQAFDCSGFTSYVYGKSNVSILRTSRSQFTQGTPIANISDLKKGDLVFFGGRGNRRSVGHVGIVTEVAPDGNTFSFVHASTNRGVTVSSSNEGYYSRRYLGARRIVSNQQ